MAVECSITMACISVRRFTGSQLKEGRQRFEIVEKVRWEQLHESAMPQLYSGTGLVLAFQGKSCETMQTMKTFSLTALSTIANRNEKWFGYPI